MLDWHIEQGLLTTSESITDDEVSPEPHSLPSWVAAALSCLGVDVSETWPSEPSTIQTDTESDGPVLNAPSPSFVPATDLPARRIGPMVVASSPRNWDRTFIPTRFGREVVRLCIDPLSGIRLRRGLRRCVRRLVRDANDQPVTTFGLLHLITYLPDFVQFRSNRSDELRLQDLYAVEGHGLVVDESEIGPIEFSSLLKSADVIQAWIDEVDLALIEDERGVAPGDLRMRCELARWLLYAAQAILGADTNFSDEHESHRRVLSDMTAELHTRIRYGCREDALPLIVLPNIGRKRARDLIGVGIRHPRDLLDLPRKMHRTITGIRGWSTKVVDRLVKDAHEEVEAGRRAHRVPRDDDIPLLGEMENS
jgi:replicative superfamily II helicase